MNKARWMLTMVVLAAEAEGASCGDVIDAAERLSCYDRIAECISTHDPQERLACYDGVQAHASPDSSDAGPAAAERPAAPTSSTQGPFALPGKPAREPEPERLVARIVEVDEGPRGRTYLTLDNGQIWRELSDNRVRFESGDEVELRPGILGSVNLRIEGTSGYVKVRRVE
jgi:hypothetical protein